MEQNRDSLLPPPPPSKKNNGSYPSGSPSVSPGTCSGEGDCLSKIVIMAIFSGFYLVSQIYSDIEIWYNKKNFNLVKVNLKPNQDEIESNTVYYWEFSNQMHCCFLNPEGERVDISLDIQAKPQNLNSTKLNDWKKKFVLLKVLDKHSYINYDGHAQLLKVCCRILALAVVLAVVCALVATNPMGWSLGAGLLIAACILLVTAFVKPDAEKKFPDDSGISMSLCP